MSLSQTTKNIQTFIKINQNPENIEITDLNKIYQELIDCITDHNHIYYIENKPIISDKEYDELFSYLKNLEEYYPHLISANSPTQQLVGQISEGFEHADHKTKLLSLENSYNNENIIERNERVKKELKKNSSEEKEEIFTYSVEPKFDGICVEIIYKDGVFTQAITRGDGTTGDDITENVKMISSIPQILNKSVLQKFNISTISIRGEIMMPKSSRTNLNKEREKNNKQVFANTRNAAAGSVKLLDSNEVKKRGLICFIYDLIYTEGENNLGETQKIIFQNLKKLGLPIFERYEIKNNINEVTELCSDKIKQKLNEYEYDFDGLVIKVNEKHTRKIIGETAHHPKRAIAYKFPAEQISTKINSIDFQVGRTGIITPVANLEPVKLSGVTISRVSLHNFDFINNKDIHLHDYVWLQRSGEVIPYITSVISERRDQNFKKAKINPPENCPSCGQKITQIEMHHYCTNTECPAQIKEKISHFVSKNCMNIEGLGDSIIEILVDQKIIKNFADLYKISDPNTKLKIHSMPGFGSKKLFEITKQLELSKTKPLRRLINALGINGVGKKMAQQITNQLQTITTEKTIGNLDFLEKQLTNKEFLEEIYGVGDKIIEGITNYFQINKNLLQELENTGLNFSAKTKKSNINENSKRKNEHFAITGSFPFSREIIIKEFEQQGLIFDNSPNKTTTNMFIGEKPGGKAQKAKDLGIKIYEGRENIIIGFPFLKNTKETKKTPTKKKEAPQMQSLF